MDYKYLKAFLLTAKYSSFSKAAAELRIAQSAVSRQIKLLEDSLNQQLIIRSSKRMVLTPQGHELFLALTDFDKHVHGMFGEEHQKEIRIGVLHGVLETWLVQFIRKHTRIQELNLTIQVDMPTKLIEGLTNRHYDLVITNDNIQNEMITSLKLFDEELVLISKNKVDLKTIETKRWITYDKVDWMHLVFKRKKSNQFIHVNSMTAIVAMVKADLGVAIIPTHLLQDDDKLQTQPVPLSKQPSIYLSTLNYANLPRHLRPFIDSLRETAKSEET